MFHVTSDAALILGVTHLRHLHGHNAVIKLAILSLNPGNTSPPVLMMKSTNAGMSGHSLRQQ